MIRFYRASVVVFAMIGLLSGSALSLSAPIVVESRSTELKDRFQERVGVGQGAAEVPVDTLPIEIEPMAIEGGCGIFVSHRFDLPNASASARSDEPSWFG